LKYSGEVLSLGEALSLIIILEWNG
jgi:hypothetical protein